MTGGNMREVERSASVRNQESNKQVTENDGLKFEPLDRVRCINAGYYGGTTDTPAGSLGTVLVITNNPWPIGVRMDSDPQECCFDEWELEIVNDDT